MKELLTHTIKALALITLIAFASCDEIYDNAWTPSLTEPSLTLSANLTQTEFSHQGGAATLTVLSNTSWTITTPSWVMCDITSGTAGKTLGVAIGSNTTKAVRSGDIIIRDSSGSEAYRITVTQQAEPTTQEHTRDLGHVFASKGETISVTSFESDVNWSAAVVEGSEWITLSPQNGNSGDALYVTTADNPSGNGRTGKIHVTYGYNRYTCLVEQSGKTITVSPASPIDFFAKGGTSGPVSISADVAATVSSSADWLTIISDGNTFTVQAQQNSSPQARSATLTITLSGVTDPPSVTIQVRQAGDTFENGHEFVDLGLSVKWATCNVGASSPTESGNYYAWGETADKSQYAWSTYRHCQGTANTLTRYNDDAHFGSVDGRATLLPSDDVASSSWGGVWRMPTLSEFGELSTKCTHRWTTQGGVGGMLITGPNGNSIFLPASGYRNGATLAAYNTDGWYWTADNASVCHLFESATLLNYNINWTRCYGCTVRAVCQ